MKNNDGTEEIFILDISQQKNGTLDIRYKLNGETRTVRGTGVCCHGQRFITSDGDGFYILSFEKVSFHENDL